jgi:TonB-linked SusC/RagA family outer membrane protein
MQDFATLAIITVRRKMQLLETAGFHRTNACAQLKRVMKLTGILILIACLHVSANGITQTINLSFENAPLETVLKDIEKQTGYTFFYRTNWVKQAKKVTVKANNLSLQQALELCFKEQPLEYSVSGKIITIAVKNEKAIAEKKKEEGRADVLVNIKGKVVSPKGEPVAKATVSIKETDINTMTDGDGYFAFENVKDDAVLLISSVGYESAEIHTNGKSFINAVLQIKMTSLDEFQVIAYGQVKKRLNTGNVSSVKAVDIEKQPVNNPLLALQGRVTGMEISQTTGVAGGGVRVQIRGINSISKGTDPLFIVDGVPYTSSTLRGYSGVNILNDGGLGSPFNFLNPNDIESIDILKDADATAIYGSRGANGVVLITTKKGKAGATKLDVNLQTGFAQVGNKLKLLSTRQYLDMRYEAFKNDGAVPNPGADYDLTLWDTTRYTDWQKELIGGTARYTDVQASLSGGNTNTQYLFGTTYHKETTVFPGSFNDQKGSGHISVNSSSLDKKFHFNFSGVYSVDNNRLGGFNFTQMAMQLPPNAPAMYNPDGTLNWEPNQQGVSTWPSQNGNPAATLNSKFNLKTFNLITNAGFSYDILKGLQLKTSLGFNNLQMNQFSALPFSTTDPSTWATGQRYAYFGDNNIQSWIIEPQLNYSGDILRGKVSALIGFTLQQNKNAGQTLTAFGFSSDEIMEDIKSATNILSGITINSLYKYNAGFGRINYNWGNKYLINLSARRDGSSRFSSSNRFNNFGAVGAGWIFSNENIIKKLFPQLSYGKLRGSYGITGNDQIGDYSYLDLYSTIIGIGVPYQGASGLYPNTILTPDLQWEETKKLEAGLSLGCLNDKILFEAAFYRNRSSNQIVSYSLPSITGFTSINKNLNALVQNMGWEFELRTINISTKKLQWNTSFNISFNRNKLLSIAKGVSPYLENLVGRTLNTNYVYDFLRVDPFTGMYTFADAHGSPTYNPDPNSDRMTVINMETKYFGGFQNSLNYKRFQLDFLFQFVRKPNGIGYLFNYIPGYYTGSSAGSNQPIEVLNRWQKAGDVKEYPKFNQNYSLSNSFDYAQTSDLVYVDASFIRLKNVSLSWQAPDAFLKKISMKVLRIFLQGQNLYTFSKYRGLDPETQNSAASLPPLRTITGGIQITL